MEQTILTWNITNWITVVIMSLLGFMIFGLVAHGFNRMSNKQDN
jgi:hypothetical protein